MRPHLWGYDAGMASCSWYCRGTRLGRGIFGLDSVARATRIGSLDFGLTTCHLPRRWTCFRGSRAKWFVPDMKHYGAQFLFTTIKGMSKILTLNAANVSIESCIESCILATFSIAGESDSNQISSQTQLSALFLAFVQMGSGRVQTRLHCWLLPQVVVATTSEWRRQST